MNRCDLFTLASFLAIKVGMALLNRFEQFYRDFKGVDMGLLHELYSPEVRFRDPVQEVTGLPQLTRYFAAAQRSVQECRFEFLDRLDAEDRSVFQWQMHYRHPRLNGGESLVLRGMSRVEFRDVGITAHEDIYDMGAMLYEHVPFFGFGVRWLKQRLQEG